MVGTLEARVLPTARKLNALDSAGLAAPSAVQVAPRAVSAPELQERAQSARELDEASEEDAA
jgi:DNA recombination protein RmuC